MGYIGPDSGLLFFNIGVEIRLLLFVIAMLALWWGLSRLWPQRWRWVEALPAYAIGTAATYWFLQRAPRRFFSRLDHRQRALGCVLARRPGMGVM